MGVAVGSSQWGASNTCCFNAVVETSGTCPALTGTVVVIISYVTFRKLRDSMLVNWVVRVILFSQTSEIPPQSLLELTEKPGKNTSSVSVNMEAAGVSFVPSDVTGVTNEKDTKKSHALTRAYSGSNTSSESRSLTLEPEETTDDNKTDNGSGKNSYRFEGAAVVREAITEGLGHKGLMHISKVLKAMRDSYASPPAIFAISNPAKNAEYTDAFKYAGENKFFASENPFENVNLGTGTFPNVYILALESTPSASGRYCLVERVAHYAELMKSLRNLYPDIRLPEKCADDNPFVPTYLVSKEKSKGLGINYISHEVSLKDTVESLKEKKFISF